MTLYLYTNTYILCTPKNMHHLADMCFLVPILQTQSQMLLDRMDLSITCYAIILLHKEENNVYNHTELLSHSSCLCLVLFT